jgi:DNA-binding ferritin-like protein (Dps family)
MNQKLIELYRSCRSKEALASQDEYKSANALLGSEVATFADALIEDCIRTLRNNGYDDAAQCLHDVHFGMDDHV